MVFLPRRTQSMHEGHKVYVPDKRFFAFFVLFFVCFVVKHILTYESALLLVHHFAVKGILLPSPKAFDDILRIGGV